MICDARRALLTGDQERRLRAFDRAVLYGLRNLGVNVDEAARTVNGLDVWWEAEMHQDGRRMRAWVTPRRPTTESYLMSRYAQREAAWPISSCVVWAIERRVHENWLKKNWAAARVLRECLRSLYPTFAPHRRGPALHLFVFLLRLGLTQEQIRHWWRTTAPARPPVPGQAGVRQGVVVARRPGMRRWPGTQKREAWQDAASVGDHTIDRPVRHGQGALALLDGDPRPGSHLIGSAKLLSELMLCEYHSTR